MPARNAAGLEQHPPMLWAVVGVVALTLVCTILQTSLVQPYLWPAGDGVHLSGTPPADTPLPARPVRPDTDFAASPVVDLVADASPADRAGIKPGDGVFGFRDPATNRTVDLASLSQASAAERLDVWRETYWLGVRGALEWRT